MPITALRAGRAPTGSLASPGSTRPAAVRGPGLLASGPGSAGHTGAAGSEVTSSAAIGPSPLANLTRGARNVRLACAGRQAGMHMDGRTGRHRGVATRADAGEQPPG